MSTIYFAPYKEAQREAKARLTRMTYLVIDGKPVPDGPYVLRVQREGSADGRETGRRKVVRRDRLDG